MGGLGSRGGRGASVPAPLQPAGRGAALLALVVGGAVVLAGCLPSSQRRIDRSVSAADSASAAIAAAAPVDTLAAVWEASPAAPLDLPTSLGWLGDRLAVVETQGGAARLFSAGGAEVGRVDLGGDFPYLAGTVGDTVVVLARGADALRWAVAGRGVVRSVPTPPGTSAALVTDSVVAVRTGGGAGEAAGAVEVLGRGGAVVARHPVAGPPWRSVGFLRAWDGRLVALSGYRPVVDVLRPAAPPGAPLDTLALRGFASPQLPRSAQYARGDVDEPPLLTSSAAPLGERLFVLNLRSDHVRIDVYDRLGQLERVLVGPERSEEVYPLDLAVRERDGPRAGGPQAGGAVEVAVLLARPPGLLQAPASRVVLYQWTPRPEPAASGPEGGGAAGAPTPPGSGRGR